jgi:hypothetical protein
VLGELACLGLPRGASGLPTVLLEALPPEAEAGEEAGCSGGGAPGGPWRVQLLGLVPQRGASAGGAGAGGSGDGCGGGDSGDAPGAPGGARGPFECMVAWDLELTPPGAPGAAGAPSAGVGAGAVAGSASLAAAHAALPLAAALPAGAVVVSCAPSVRRGALLLGTSSGSVQLWRVGPGAPPSPAAEHACVPLPEGDGVDAGGGDGRGEAAGSRPGLPLGAAGGASGLVVGAALHASGGYAAAVATCVDDPEAGDVLAVWREALGCDEEVDGSGREEGEEGRGAAGASAASVLPRMVPDGPPVALEDTPSCVAWLPGGGLCPMLAVGFSSGALRVTRGCEGM